MEVSPIKKNPDAKYFSGKITLLSSLHSCPLYLSLPHNLQSLFSLLSSLHISYLPLSLQPYFSVSSHIIFNLSSQALLSSIHIAYLPLSLSIKTSSIQWRSLVVSSLPGNPLLSKKGWGSPAYCIANANDVVLPRPIRYSVCICIHDS